MIGIMNDIVAVVAPAVDITLVATTGLLEAVKKENEMHTNCKSCNLQVTIVNLRGHTCTSTCTLDMGPNYYHHD